MIDVYITPGGGTGGGGGGAVTSVFGRIGVVVAAVGDYTQDQISAGAIANGSTATTQAPLDASTKVATDAYVDSAVAAAIAAALKPNPSFCSIIEEFVGGLTTTGALASLGWGVDTIGSAPTFTGTQAVTPNLGIIQFNTAAAATAGQGGGLRLVSLASSSGTLVSNLQSNVGWELQWIFKLLQTTATRFRIGIDGVDTIVAGFNGLHLRYDTNASFADTNFIFESTIASVATTIDSGIAADTNWHRVKISSSVAGTAIFTLYDSAGNVQSTKSLAISFTTTVGMTPVVIIATDTTAQKSVQLDYMSFFFPALAR